MRVWLYSRRDTRRQRRRESGGGEESGGEGSGDDDELDEHCGGGATQQVDYEYEDPTPRFVPVVTGEIVEGQAVELPEEVGTPCTQKLLASPWS